MVSYQNQQLVSWDEHLRTWIWNQGEHVTLLGPTGVGKTTLARAILPKREFSLVLATKPKDPLLKAFPDHKMVRDWPASGNRILLWPRIDKPEDIDRQREIMDRTLRSVYREGGWTIYLDEARYITDYLGLARMVELLWIQGRAMGITLVASAQRPRHLPLAAYSQASHLYVWPTRDRQDLRRLQEMAGGPTMSQVERAMEGLPVHACVYMGQDGTMVSTMVVP